MSQRIKRPPKKKNFRDIRFDQLIFSKDDEGNDMISFNLPSNSASSENDISNAFTSTLLGTGGVNSTSSTVINIHGLCLSEEDAHSLRAQCGYRSSSSTSSSSSSLSSRTNQRTHPHNNNHNDNISEELKETKQRALDLRTELAEVRLNANESILKEKETNKLLQIQIDKLNHELLISNAKLEEYQGMVSLLENEKSNSEWNLKASNDKNVKNKKKNKKNKKVDNDSNNNETEEDGDGGVDGGGGEYISTALEQAEEALRDLNTSDDQPC